MKNSKSTRETKLTQPGVAPSIGGRRADPRHYFFKDTKIIILLGN